MNVITNEKITNARTGSYLEIINQQNSNSSINALTKAGVAVVAAASLLSNNLQTKDFVEFNHTQQNIIEESLYPHAQTFQNIVFNDIITHTNENIVWVIGDIEMTKTEEAIQSIKSDISDMKNDISGIKGEISGIKGEISGVKGEISGIKGDIKSINVQLKLIYGVVVPVGLVMWWVATHIHKVKAILEILSQ